MRSEKILKLSLAGMFAALAFICFSYLRIEIPMGGAMTGKIYIGHTFIILSALILGAKYGALSGAIGLTLADILAGYTTSAPPTFFAKFLLGFATAFIAYSLYHLEKKTNDKSILNIATISAIGGSFVNVITEPSIRFSFKYFILGVPYEIAYLSSINCAISMFISAIPSIFLAVFLYKVLEKNILKTSIV